MVDDSPYDSLFVVQACLNVETNQVGFCCRDPLYKDPWPADVPMPVMPAMPAAPAPPVAPVVQEPVFVQCSSDEMCLNAQVCNMKLGTFNSQSGVSHFTVLYPIITSPAYRLKVARECSEIAHCRDCQSKRLITLIVFSRAKVLMGRVEYAVGFPCLLPLK